MDNTGLRKEASLAADRIGDILCDSDAREEITENAVKALSIIDLLIQYDRDRSHPRLYQSENEHLVQEPLEEAIRLARKLNQRKGEPSARPQQEA